MEIVLAQNHIILVNQQKYALFTFQKLKALNLYLFEGKWNLHQDFSTV